jgi:hypothetical protein
VPTSRSTRLAEAAKKTEASTALRGWPASSPRRRVISALMAEVHLLIEDDSTEYAWTAPSGFCDPWISFFGLLGLTSFFDQFKVTIASYEEWIELELVN